MGSTACDDASATPSSTSSSPVSSTPISQPAIMRGLIIIAFCATLVALAWTEDREHHFDGSNLAAAAEKVEDMQEKKAGLAANMDEVQAHMPLTGELQEEWS